MIYTPHWPIPLGFKPIDLGLERIRKVLDNLGNPEKKLPPVVHVAGTNGKGSTIAFMRAILEAAGYKAHVYTSPHLVYFNERIVLAGKEVEDDFLYDVLEECRLASQDIPLTFFEGTTAAAFFAFSHVKADIILLETGLGGRLDATNVIENPALTVITPVSFDHTEFLGNTLAEIASEKAGILKANIPCVVSAQAEEAKQEIIEKAASLSSPLLLQGKDWQTKALPEGFLYISAKNTLTLPSPSLLGAHQLINAGAAITAVQSLRGFSIAAGHIVQGIAHAKHRARLQRLDNGMLPKLLPEGWELWLDGGHNPAGGEVLGEVAKTWRDKPLYIVSGMLRDKDCIGFFAPLAETVEQVVCIPIPEEPKSFSPDALKACVEETGIDAVSTEDIIKAITHIATSTRQPSRILICGSLYLAGHVLGLNNG